MTTEKTGLAPGLPNPSCRLCASANLKLKGIKQGCFVDAPFYFYECLECGFLFAEPITDVSVYNDAYYAGHGADPLVNYEQEYAAYLSTPVDLNSKILLLLCRITSADRMLLLLHQLSRWVG